MEKTTRRAAIYARYSSDLQSPRSIGDQVRELRAALPRLGLVEASEHSDAATSGSSMARPGLEDALEEIESGRADVLFAEALDRISRDLEHVARVAKRVMFRGARIITLSEGEIGPLHIGLSGTMAQVFLQQLAEKTRRGMRGVAMDGRIAAGRAYGYRPTQEKGVFEIVPEEAEIVREIMTDYAAGKSARLIAKSLNARGVSGPRGGPWKANTILGDRSAGTGIINNELYIGRIIWNRSTWRKDPETGRRRPFPVPPEEWSIAEAPRYRLVDQSLWEDVRKRQGEYSARGAIRRPTRLLSGLLVCGACGARLTILGRERYGCPAHKEQGTCDNGRTIAATEAESRFAEALSWAMYRPELVDEFVDAYVDATVEYRNKSRIKLETLTRQLRKAEDDLEETFRMISSVTDAGRAALGKRIDAAAERADTIRSEIESIPKEITIIVPEVTREYLKRSIRKMDSDEVPTLIRGAITRILVVPKAKRGEVDLLLEGDLARILWLAHEPKKKKRLVAGAGFEPAAFRL